VLGLGQLRLSLLVALIANAKHPRWARPVREESAARMSSDNPGPGAGAAPSLGECLLLRRSSPLPTTLCSARPLTSSPPFPSPLPTLLFSRRLYRLRPSVRCSAMGQHRRSSQRRVCGAVATRRSHASTACRRSSSRRCSCSCRGLCSPRPAALGHSIRRSGRSQPQACSSPGHGQEQR